MNGLADGIAFISRIPAVLQDHFELLQLECRYESEVGRRRFGSLAFVAFCFVSSVTFLQAALIYGLWRAGVPLYATALGLAVIWGILGGWVYQKYGRRDPTTGQPFEGSRDEMRRSLQWMQKHLS